MKKKADIRWLTTAAFLVLLGLSGPYIESDILRWVATTSLWVLVLWLTVGTAGAIHLAKAPEAAIRLGHMLMVARPGFKMSIGILVNALIVVVAMLTGHPYIAGLWSIVSVGNVAVIKHCVGMAALDIQREAATSKGFIQ